MIGLAPAYLTYALAYSIALRFAARRTRSQKRIVEPPRSVSRVLVVGATGGTGQQLVRQGLERGLEVTAFVRRRDALGLAHPRLRIVEGDVVDSASVDRAMSGQQAVLCALGHRRFWVPSTVLSSGTGNVLASMEQHGASRLVCETALGLGDTAGRMGVYYTFFVLPVILPLYFWDKALQERRIIASNVNWTIVRPSALTDRMPTGRYKKGARVGNFLQTRSVSRADVAAFMLDQLSSSEFAFQRVGLSD